MSEGGCRDCRGIESTYIDYDELSGRGVAKPEAADVRAWDGRHDVGSELLLLTISRVHALEWGHDELELRDGERGEESEEGLALNVLGDRLCLVGASQRRADGSIAYLAKSEANVREDGNIVPG